MENFISVLKDDADNVIGAMLKGKKIATSLTVLTRLVKDGKVSGLALLEKDGQMVIRVIEELNDSDRIIERTVEVSVANAKNVNKIVAVMKDAEAKLAAEIAAALASAETQGEVDDLVAFLTADLPTETDPTTPSLWSRIKGLFGRK